MLLNKYKKIMKDAKIDNVKTEQENRNFFG